MTTRSAPCRRFLESLQIGYEEWREGEGYDLQALDQIQGDERKEMESLLVDRLHEDGGWREIEALAHLGTPTAKDAIRRALQSSDVDLCLHAAEQLHEMGEEIALDHYIFEAMRTADLYSGASYAIDLAPEHATPLLRRGLLDVALHAEPEVRVHAAALALFLAGKAEEPFDWNHRPFFLRFAEDDADELLAAHKELCERVGPIEG